MTFRSIPRGFRSHLRNFTKIRRNLSTKIPLQTHSFAEFIKIIPQFWFIDLVLDRHIIKSYLQNSNFCITQGSVAKVNNRFWTKVTIKRVLSVLLLGPATLTFCNSSKIEINSLFWDVRPRLYGRLFSKELEELCISPELVLNRGGVIPVLDELLLSSFIKSK